MSTISEALKRAAGQAAAPQAGSSPSPARDRWPRTA